MKSKEELLNEFFSNNGKKKYIYGINEGVFDVLKIIKQKNVEFVGFVDNNTQYDSFKKHPVYHDCSIVEPGSIVLSCDYGINPISIKKYFESCGIDFVDIFAFCKYYHVPVRYYCWHNDFEDHYNNHKAEYDKLISLLSDEKSKEDISNIINFRITYDSDYMNGFISNEDGMYFEPFLNLKKSGESFADIGSYDGFTSLQFIKQCPDYTKIWCFEPAKELMEEVKKI